MSEKQIFVAMHVGAILLLFAAFWYYTNAAAECDGVLVQGLTEWVCVPNHD